MKKAITADNESWILIKKAVQMQQKIDNTGYGNKLLLFGAGNHTIQLLKYMDFSQYEVNICDSYRNGEWNGFHIKKPDNKWFQWADKIIISSFEQQQELLSFTEKQGYAHKAVKLYDEADRVPFYIAEIEMNAEKMQDICLENEYGWIDPYSAWQYSGQGKWYEDHVEKDFFHTVTKNYYLRYIDSGMNVLDVGAGTGRLSVEVYKKGAEVTAVDTSVSMLNILKEKEPGIKTVIVDNEKLPFQENVFDRVVSCDAMIHFPNWRDFLREHLRVVRQGGFLIYNMYNDDHLMQISDKRFIRASYIAGGKNYYVTENPLSPQQSWGERSKQ